MNEPIQYCLNIYCPDRLLWWLIIICVIGLITTAGAMVQINKFIVTHQDKQLSVLKLQGIHTIRSVTEYLTKLPAKSLNTLRTTLLIDFAFMPFLYLLMSAISCLAQRHQNLGEGWSNLLYFLCLLPFVTWICDVIENLSTLSILTAFKDDRSAIGKKQTMILSISSVLKWLTGLIWAQCMISLLISYFIENYL